MFKVALIAALGVATVLRGAEASSFEMDATDAAFIQAEVDVETDPTAADDEWLAKAEKELAALKAEELKVDYYYRGSRLYSPRNEEGAALIAKAKAEYEAARDKANAKLQEITKYKNKLAYEREMERWRREQGIKPASLVEVDAPPANSAIAAHLNELKNLQDAAAKAKAIYDAALKRARPANDKNSEKAKRLAVIAAKKAQLKAKIAAYKAKKSFAKKAKKSAAKVAKTVRAKAPAALKKVAAKAKKVAKTAGTKAKKVVKAVKAKKVARTKKTSKKDKKDKKTENN